MLFVSDQFWRAPTRAQNRIHLVPSLTKARSRKGTTGSSGSRFRLIGTLESSHPGPEIKIPAFPPALPALASKVVVRHTLVAKLFSLFFADVWRAPHGPRQRHASSIRSPKNYLTRVPWNPRAKTVPMQPARLLNRSLAIPCGKQSITHARSHLFVGSGELRKGPDTFFPIFLTVRPSLPLKQTRYQRLKARTRVRYPSSWLFAPFPTVEVPPLLTQSTPVGQSPYW